MPVPLDKATRGAIHSTKISGNFGPKLNGSVRSNRKRFEKTGPPFEVDHVSRSDRLEFWLNGSRPRTLGTRFPAMVTSLVMHSNHKDFRTPCFQQTSSPRHPGTPVPRHPGTPAPLYLLNLVQIARIIYVCFVYFAAIAQVWINLHWQHVLCFLQ